MIIAIDPGIDATGIARFYLGDWSPREPFSTMMRRLDKYAVVRTSPDTPLPERLERLAVAVSDFVDSARVDHCYIERSSKSGVYAARRNRQQTKGAINAKALQLLDYATGALVVGAMLENIPVTMVPAPRSSKKSRHELVLFGLKQISHPIAQQARPSPDLLCAIWLGASCLADARYAPRQAP